MRCRLDGLGIYGRSGRFTAGTAGNEKQQGWDRVQSFHLHSPPLAVESAHIPEGEDVAAHSNIRIVWPP
jgi:hypothetical protein